MNFDISWPLALLSITGTVFNIKKKVLCFYLWGIGEFFWIALDLNNRQHGRVFLDVVFTLGWLFGVFILGVKKLINIIPRVNMRYNHAVSKRGIK